MEQTAINSTATTAASNAMFQCIVCQRILASPNDFHRHQSYSHTTEELSLSIMGLLNEAIRIFPIPNSIVYDNSWLHDPVRQAEVYTYSANLLSDNNNNCSIVNYAFKKDEIAGKESLAIDPEYIDDTRDEEEINDQRFPTNNSFTGGNFSGGSTILDLSVKNVCGATENAIPMDTQPNNIADSIEGLCNDLVRMNSGSTKRNSVPSECPVPRKTRKMIRREMAERLLRNDEKEGNEEIGKSKKTDKENVDSEEQDLNVNSQDSLPWFEPKKTKKTTCKARKPPPPQKRALNLKKVVRKPAKKKEAALIKKMKNPNCRKAQLVEQLGNKNIPAHCEMKVLEDPKKVPNEPVVLQEIAKPEDENLKQVQPNRDLNREESVANLSMEAGVIEPESHANNGESINPQIWNLSQLSNKSRFEAILADIENSAVENITKGAHETPSQEMTGELEKLKSQNVYAPFFRGDYTDDAILAFVNAAEEGFKGFELTPTEHGSIRIEELENQNIDFNLQSFNVSPESFLLYFGGEEVIIGNTPEANGDERNALMGIENSTEIAAIEPSQAIKSDSLLRSFLYSKKDETNIEGLPVVKTEEPIVVQTHLENPEDVADEQIKQLEPVNENIRSDAGVDHNSISNAADSLQFEKKTAKIHVLATVNAKKSPGSKKKATTSKTAVKSVNQGKTKKNLGNKKCKVEAVADHNSIANTGDLLPELKNEEEEKMDVLPAINAKKPSTSKLKSKDPKTATNAVKRKTAKKNLEDQNCQMEDKVDHSLIASTASSSSKLKKEEAKISMGFSTATVKKTNPKRKAKTPKTVVLKPIKKETDVYSYTEDDDDEEEITSFHEFRAQKPKVSTDKMKKSNNDPMELAPSVSNIPAPTESDSKEVLTTKKSIKRKAPKRTTTKSKTSSEKSSLSGKAKQVCNLLTQHDAVGDSVEQNCISVNKENIEIKDTSCMKLSKKSKSSTKKNNLKITENIGVMEETAATAGIAEDQNAKKINCQHVIYDPLLVAVEPEVAFGAYPPDLNDSSILIFDPETRKLVWDSVEMEDSESESDELMIDTMTVDLPENEIPQFFMNDNGIIESEENKNAPTTPSGTEVATKDEGIQRKKNPDRRSTRSKKAINYYGP